MTNMKQLEADLTALIEQRLVRDDPQLTHRPESLHSRARLITYVAFAGIRHAWSCWAETGGSGTLADRLVSSFDELRDIAGGRD
jgi:hypothetical protein